MRGLLAGWCNQSMAVVTVVVIVATDHGDGGVGGYERLGERSLGAGRVSLQKCRSSHGE